MNLRDLRELGHKLNEALTCPNCDGSMIVLATEHQGHGVGTHGAVNYRATAHEPLDVLKHCTCPGGPLWSLILDSPIGEQGKLQEAQDKLPKPGYVAFYNAEKDSFFWVTCRQFRTILINAIKEHGESQDDTND